MENLDQLVRAERSGDIRDVPITWAEARKEGIAIERLLGMRG